MKMTRRDILTLAGGSVVGALMSPLPWKLLDDTAIWTQNWSLIPPLPRGPESTVASACALCPGGCAVLARCVGRRAVYLSGGTHHPFSSGTLCSAGLTGHHLASHPLRLRSIQRFTHKGTKGELTNVSEKESLADLSRLLRASGLSEQAGAVAVLDRRPGRAMSSFYGQFLNMFESRFYIVPPAREESTLDALRECIGSGAPPLGFDFENADVVLSFGAPLLDGWGTPGRMHRVFGDKKRSGRKLIQVESVQSRTALQADTWLTPNPGSEGILALSIAEVILREGLYHAGAEQRLTDFTRYRNLASGFPPDVAAPLIGISSGSIVETARALAGKPSIILAGADPGGGPFDRLTETLVASINPLLGNVGRPGGILERRDLPSVPGTVVPVTVLTEVPDKSISFLIIDSTDDGATFPSALLRRKLTGDNAVVVSLSPYLSSRSALADYLVPAPAAYESMEEVVTPSGAVRTSFSLSLPLIEPRYAAMHPTLFLTKLAHAAGMVGLPPLTDQSLVRQRVDRLYATPSGSVVSAVDGTRRKVSEFSSPNELWQAMNGGDCWLDDEPRISRPRQFAVLERFPDKKLQEIGKACPVVPGTLMLMPTGWRAAIDSGASSPLLSKVFQESDLRNVAGRVFVNPSTAAAVGVKSGQRAVVRTKMGSATFTVVESETVMPGVISAVVGPLSNGMATKPALIFEDILALCDLQENDTWRMTEATMCRANEDGRT
jgi:menaquinone reductase, molybdopterin-binding-like subunit